MKYKYGDSWERFPIEKNEIWQLKNGSKLAIHNIFDPLLDFMLDVDLLFVDPPWNRGNLNSFYTKAERTDYVNDFSDFEAVIFQRIQDINPKVCYLEVGFQAVDKWQEELEKLYPIVQRWQVTYYKKNICYLLRGGHEAQQFDYSNMDESECIYKLAGIEEYNLVGDFCMGLGLVGLAAYAVDKRFAGTELNKRRLAVLIDKLNKQGAKWYTNVI